MTALWTEASLTFPALEGNQEGYEVYIPVDAVGGTSVAAYEAALRRIEQAGVTLISPGAGVLRTPARLVARGDSAGTLGRVRELRWLQCRDGHGTRAVGAIGGRAGRGHRC